MPHVSMTVFGRDRPPRRECNKKDPQVPTSAHQCRQAPTNASKIPEPYQTYGFAKMKTENVSRERHAGGKNRYHTERNVTPSRQSSDHSNSERVHPPEAERD